MKLTTISSKNQITLPVNILRALGLKQGSKALIKKEKKDAQKYIAIMPVVGTIADHYLGFGGKNISKTWRLRKIFKKTSNRMEIARFHQKLNKYKKTSFDTIFSAVLECDVHKLVKILLKLISQLTVGLMTIIGLMIYLCPMSGIREFPSAIAAGSEHCASDSTVISIQHSMGNMETCFNFHLAAARNLTQILFNKPILLILFLAAAIIWFKISKTNMLLAAQKKFTRYKQLYRLYAASVRLQSRKKICAWLALFLESRNRFTCIVLFCNGSKTKSDNKTIAHRRLFVTI